MVKAYAEAKYDQLHEKQPFHDGAFAKWGEKRTAETPYHYRDGVNLWVAESDLTPHDHFLGGAKDCAECASSGSGVDQEQDEGGQD